MFWRLGILEITYKTYFQSVGLVLARLTLESINIESKIASRVCTHIVILSLSQQAV